MRVVIVQNSRIAEKILTALIYLKQSLRQRREILGIRSSVRQRSVRSSPPRRRKFMPIFSYNLSASVDTAEAPHFHIQSYTRATCVVFCL